MVTTTLGTVLAILISRVLFSGGSVLIDVLS